MAAARHELGTPQHTVVVLGPQERRHPPEASALLARVVEIPVIGTGSSLDVAVAGSLVAYRLAGLV
ncbi:hypothetical protein [Pseudonocardia abyssalis]|uniref:hypothetical protein n=1 Tax=Pseudonocardia abyssalis TaxID=2792008 RepID=UPI001C4A285C|nr:hypothetical protein [Pseudonocardia abyssalis]